MSYYLTTAIASLNVIRNPVFLNAVKFNIECSAIPLKIGHSISYKSVYKKWDSLPNAINIHQYQRPKEEHKYITLYIPLDVFYLHIFKQYGIA